MNERLKKAMWEGDEEVLRDLAPCGCCCADHFFEHCPAREWGGCRGQASMTRSDYEEWEQHYAKHHGMSREKFYSGEDEKP